MLLLLDGQTWTRDQQTTSMLAREVVDAMDAGVHIILAHEVPGGGGEDDGRHTVAFETFFATTPSELLTAGLYHEIAVPLQGVHARRQAMRCS